MPDTAPSTPAAAQRPRRLVIIGAVAAGTSVGAKARRNDEQLEIVVYERDRDISYSGCGLPYYVGGEVADADELHPRDPAWFAKRYNMDIRIGHEVLAVDHPNRTLRILDLATGTEFTDRYDTLVLATGARSIVPPMPGVDAPGVFTVRNVQSAEAIRSWILTRRAKTAVVVGSGFIGLEMAEQLTEAGLEVTIVERLPQVMPALDADMAFRVQEELERHHVTVHLARSVTAIDASDDAVVGVRLDNGDTLPADVVIVSVGVRPDTALALQVGAELGPTGAIKLDHSMRTTVKDVYAVGDVAESYSLITGAPIWRPLGSTANKMGRIAGDTITGGTLTHRGILGTGIVRVFDLGVAHTGLTETEAKAQGFDIEVVHNIKPAHATYIGGRDLIIKAIAERGTGRLLGAQAIGPQGVDKRIDVIATAISFGAHAEDLFHLDLAYSPPFATTKDPVHYTGMALDNALTDAAPLITPAELDERRKTGEVVQIVDVRAARDYAKSHIPDAVNIPLAELRERAGELDPATATVTYCNKGVSGNAGQNILLRLGFGTVYNLSGGNNNYQAHRRSSALDLDKDPALDD
jgi:NADPH-dependent 2,4-dienoyl-CoA reductase/sulfur reductase-like enzyme/rhodanese-related sulfurtransferase